jgi:hypothetical protein
MTDVEREAFIEGAMWARAELSAELTEEEVAELLDRGLMPSTTPSASARASPPSGEDPTLERRQRERRMRRVPSVSSGSPIPVAPTSRQATARRLEAARVLDRRSPGEHTREAIGSATDGRGR